MPTDWQENKPEYVRRMSDDGGGGLASLPEVEDNLVASFEEVVLVVDDPADLPATASIRPAGSFSDAESLKEYLDSGGLLVVDASGNTEPIGFVWCLMMFDEVLQQDVWQVYIDDNTN